MTALYVIAAEYRQAVERLADLGLDDQTVADTLEAMAGDLEVKAVNVAKFARGLEATAAAIKQAEADMAERRRGIEKRAESLRDYILRAMEGTGVLKIECPEFALSVKKKPPSVDVFDAAQIPDVYMRQPEPPPPAPDKILIKRALGDGLDVPGARLVQGTRLDIK